MFHKHILLNPDESLHVLQDVGDFASVVFYVLQNRCPRHGTLFIQEVNDCLDGIAINNAAKKKDLVRKFMVKLITNMSALELKWLTRMIVKVRLCGNNSSNIQIGMVGYNKVCFVLIFGTVLHLQQIYLPMINVV